MTEATTSEQLAESRELTFMSEAMNKMPIDQHLIQEIFNKIAGEINAIVSIFAERGEIIATSRRQRIGDFHEGGAKIMAKEADSFEFTAEEAAVSSSMFEGVTLPIEFDGERKPAIAHRTRLPRRALHECLAMPGRGPWDRPRRGRA